MRSAGTPSSSIVSVCATLSSLVDLIYIDSGHGGRDDRGHTCACESDFSHSLGSDQVTISDILTCENEKIFDYVGVTRPTTV